MPTYEYECKKCGKIEVEQKISDEPLTRCPKCFSCCLKKLISQSSFSLKGSGWYKDGYSSKKKN